MAYPGTPPRTSPADAERVRESRYRESRDLAAPKLLSGKPYEDWTEREALDAVQWRLGPRFRQGLAPPPEPEWMIPPIPGSASDTKNSWRGSMAESD
jgi:hypothetical protein